MYGPNDKTIPQGWVHNLEHGALVLLYRGDSEGATPEGQQQLKDFFAVFPPSPICNIAPGTERGPVFTRFDSMKTPFAALVWDRVLPLQDLDTRGDPRVLPAVGRAAQPGAALPGCVRPSPSRARDRARARPRARAGARRRAPARARPPARARARQPPPARADRPPVLALVKPEAGPGLVLREVPEPAIGINDVLIRVHKTGICGTDLHIESWDPWAAKTIHPPLIVGHEFVGEIVEVGSNVVDFHAGDLVSGEGHVVCGRCRHCLAGRRHLCANTIGLGVGRDGAFAEFVALPMTNIWHHWSGIDEEIAAIFDPFGNAVHTALAFPVLGEDVLDLGRRPDRADGDRRRPPRRRPPHRGQRAQRLPARARDADGRDGRHRPARARPARHLRRAGHGRGLRRRARDVGQRRGAAQRHRGMAHGGGDRPPRHPDRRDPTRHQRGRVQVS